MGTVKRSRAPRDAQEIGDQHLPSAQTAISVIEPVAEKIKRFPGTRYYGSKRKLLSWIFQSVAGLKFETVLDAFGGTATVSAMFQAMGKEVRYHDGLLFNRDVAIALLRKDELLPKASLEVLVNECEHVDGFVAEAFEAIFYSDEENRWIDGFLTELGNLPDAELHGPTLRYLLYQACLKKRPFNLFHRANYELRSNSNVKRSFGNAKTWETSFASHMLQAFDELSRHRAGLKSDAKIDITAGYDALEIDESFDLVYLDPPYISTNASRNRDGYWKRYHFLEGVANYDAWPSLVDMSSKIRLLQEPVWFQDWSTKEKFRERLFEMIAQHKHSIVVLSYVTGAYPTLEELRTEFYSLFDSVSVHSIEHHHALSKVDRRELLFVGRPK